VWAVLDPLLSRALEPRYSTARLLGTAVVRGRSATPAGVAIHLANGAAAGAAFGALRLRGVRTGLAAASGEHLALWPLMAVLDRVHPARRSGALPPLATSARVFAHETAGHAVFGLVLGALTGAAPRPRAGQSS
jgi:hypothetical protein